MNWRPKSVCLWVFAVMAAGASVFGGDLTPPAGPILPTMKPLDEVEPRVAINAQNTPGDADSQFKITAPGSYYLTENVTGVAGRHGIEITTSSVSIDLCGFSMSGGAGTLAGIRATDNGDDVVIRNGLIQNWGGAGVDIDLISGGLVERLVVANCGGAGIMVGNSTSILACVAHDNALDGIRNVTGGAIVDCASHGNGVNGIRAGGGTTVTNCVAGFNDVSGILSFSACTITNCSTFSNTGDGISLVSTGSSAIDCASFGNAEIGIDATSASVVRGCTVSNNVADGIRVTSDCLVRGNSCDSNGNLGDGAGIHATGSDNTIEGNRCSDADRGIEIDLGGNFISRNTCAGNSTNWNVAAGNVCLVVAATTAAAINGNSGGTAPGSTDPNANFTY